MCIPYLFIDASPEDYPEEENIYEEEEEYFDQYTNQGKLIPCRLLPWASYISAGYIIARHHCNLFRDIYQSQVLILQAFTLFIKAYFYIWPLSKLRLLQEFKFGLASYTWWVPLTISYYTLTSC